MPRATDDDLARWIAAFRGPLIGLLASGGNDWGAAEEIAHAVAFLASPGAGYVTGTELHVNGGMYMA